jgi:hypothetical protein
MITVLGFLFGSWLVGMTGLIAYIVVRDHIHELREHRSRATLDAFLSLPEGVERLAVEEAEDIVRGVRS